MIDVTKQKEKKTFSLKEGIIISLMSILPVGILITILEQNGITGVVPTMIVVFFVVAIIKKIRKNAIAERVHTFKRLKFKGLQGTTRFNSPYPNISVVINTKTDANDIYFEGNNTIKISDVCPNDGFHDVDKNKLLSNINDCYINILEKARTSGVKQVSLRPIGIDSNIMSPEECFTAGLRSIKKYLPSAFLRYGHIGETIFDEIVFISSSQTEREKLVEAGESTWVKEYDEEEYL